MSSPSSAVRLRESHAYFCYSPPKHVITYKETKHCVKGSIIFLNFWSHIHACSNTIPTSTTCVYPYSTSEYTLYEDDGHTTKYQAAPPQYATQLFSMKTIDQYVYRYMYCITDQILLYTRYALQITIGEYDGYKFDGRPGSRGYEVHIFGCWPGG